jgi:putative endonuclease
MKIANPTARIGEEAACTFLKNKDYKILDRNYRKNYTEIDIIAVSKDKVLVFVEVKTRTSKKFGEPLESIGFLKMQNLIKACLFYKNSHKDLPDLMRIDGIGVYYSQNVIQKIEHIENISGF